MIRRVAIVLLLLLAACGGGQQKLLGAGYEIKKVHFKGVKRFSKAQVLGHLNIGEKSWFPLAPDVPFDEALLASDLQRIEKLYESYGYLQARVLDVTTEVDDKKRTVNITIHVYEGMPVLVTKINFRWDSKAPVPEKVRKQVEATAAVVLDEAFEKNRLNASVGNLRSALMQRGYPLARVTGSATVMQAARSAEIILDILPGPAAVVTGVDFEGLVRVPRYLADVEVEFATDRPYSPALVSQVEESLRAMRVFRWVAAQPARPEDVNKTDKGHGIRLRVRVSEADPQSVRIGGQLSVETIRWQEQLRADYTHTNLFGHLTRLDLDTAFGWAELPNPWDPSLHGPVVNISPAFTKKGLLEKHLRWLLNPSYDMNVQEGYQFYSVNNRVGVSRWFAGFFNLGLTHNYQFVDFFNVDPQLDSSESILGRDFRDPFQLGWIELKAQAWLVNSILDPDDGLVLETIYGLAGQALASDYDFQRITAGLKAYWTPWRRLQVAAQMQTGLILPYGNHPGAPFSHRFYLGGANTVRGFGARRLSPRLEECTGGDECSSIPVGGYTMIQANLELRWWLHRKMALVTFSDLGDVQAAEKTWNTDEWNYTAGSGLRVDSPLGLVRLDFGWRLNDPGVYPDEPRWALYFGFGNTF